jgi:hypothetical protein
VIYTEHGNAESFLSAARAALARHEAANGLMLGVCLRLVREPDAYGGRAYLATIETDAGLRVAALMTPPHVLQLYSADDHDAAGFDLVADALLRGEWNVPGVLARKAAAEEFATIWGHRTGASCRTEMRLRVHELRQVIHPTYPPGEFRPATVADLDLVRRWAYAFHDDCFDDDEHKRAVTSTEAAVRNGGLFFWIDGEPRSMAGARRPTPHSLAIGGAYTPPEFRRRGYATAVVARLSQKILDDGKQFCTLHTDLANPTSNSIYRKIGYRAVADVVDVRFES